MLSHLCSCLNGDLLKQQHLELACGCRKVCLEQGLAKRGPQMSSSGCIMERQISGTLCQIYSICNPDCFNKPSGYILKFEDHCPGEIASQGWTARLRALGKQTSENTREPERLSGEGSHFPPADDADIRSNCWT